MHHRRILCYILSWRILDILMYWHFICLEMNFLWSFLVTLITRILDILMYRHFMSFENTFLCKVGFTLITRILDILIYCHFLMFRLPFSVQLDSQSLYGCLINYKDTCCSQVLTFYVNWDCLINYVTRTVQFDLCFHSMACT